MSLMYTTRYIHLVLLTFVAGFLKAQTPLENYIEIGLKNNQQFLKEQLNTQLALEEGLSAKSFFFPDVSFDASYLRADGGRTIAFPLGDLFNPAYEALNGLTGTNQFPTDIENVNEQFLPNDFHETKVQLLQPLFNTDIYYSYKASQANSSAQEAKEDSFKNQLVFQITKAYYDHLKVLEQKRILDSTKGVVKELVRVNGKFVKFGVATKDVLYDAQAQLDQIDAQLAVVRKNINTSRIFFNFLLNRDLEREILTEQQESPGIKIFNEDQLKDKAISNRTELKEIQSGLDAQEYLLKRERSYLIPKVAFGAEIGYQGFGYSFDANQDYYLLSFNLNFPLFQGGRNKSSIRKASIQKEQLNADFQDVTNQIKLEVAQAFYEYQEAVEIHKARLSELKNAEENFKIIQSKYKQNQVLLVQFNESRNTLTTSQLNESIARYNIKIAEANINRTVQNNL